MSLSSIIRSTAPKDKEIYNILKNISPKKDQFKTVSGDTAFSKYPPICDYFLNNRIEAGLVGTTFDLMTKLVSSHYTKDKINFDSLLSPATDRVISQSDAIYDLLIEYEQIIENTLTMPNTDHFTLNDNLIDAVSFLAKLESYYRSGWFFRELDAYGEKYFISKPSNEVRNEVTAMTKAFQNTFFGINGMVRSDSLITYTPHFSNKITYAFRGIDADICIDSTLYDIKSTKKLGYRISEISQLTAYYLSYLLDRLVCSDIDGEIQRHNITRIAFYRVRYNQIEYFDVRNFSVEFLTNTLLELNSKLSIGFNEKHIKPNLIMQILNKD